MKFMLNCIATVAVVIFLSGCADMVVNEQQKKAEIADELRTLESRLCRHLLELDEEISKTAAVVKESTGDDLMPDQAGAPGIIVTSLLVCVDGSIVFDDYVLLKNNKEKKVFAGNSHTLTVKAGLADDKNEQTVAVKYNMEITNASGARIATPSLPLFDGQHGYIINEEENNERFSGIRIDLTPFVLKNVLKK